MKPDLIDLMLFLGLVLIGTGLWFYDFRVSLVVVGSLVVGLGVFLACMGTRRAARTVKDKG